MWIDFEDEKPLIKYALAVFYEGKVYYAPLIRPGKNDVSNEYGIRVATPDSVLKLIDPLDRDDYLIFDKLSGWSVYAPHPQYVEGTRGNLFLDGANWLQDGIFTVSEQNFYLEATFTPTLIDNVTRHVFELYKADKVRLILRVTADKRLSVWLNGTTIITDTYYGYELRQQYRVVVTQTNGTWKMQINGSDIGTKKANMTTGDYQVYIGACEDHSQPFIGRLHELKFGTDKDNLVCWLSVGNV